MIVMRKRYVEIEISDEDESEDINISKDINKGKKLLYKNKIKNKDIDR